MNNSNNYYKTSYKYIKGFRKFENININFCNILYSTFYPLSEI